MDPAFFKLDDINEQQCVSCGYAIEFWKDDIFLPCPSCNTRNVNARVGSTCLAWCKEAQKCVGNKGISEWLKEHGAASGQKDSGQRSAVSGQEDQ
jgi:predicted RNA-binding Zn-ribbon protein involved in translation (DUF1610 family)